MQANPINFADPSGLIYESPEGWVGCANTGTGDSNCFCPPGWTYVPLKECGAGHRAVGEPEFFTDHYWWRANYYANYGVTPICCMKGKEYALPHQLAEKGIIASSGQCGDFSHLDAFNPRESCAGNFFAVLRELKVLAPGGSYMPFLTDLFFDERVKTRGYMIGFETGVGRRLQDKLHDVDIKPTGSAGLSLVILSESDSWGDMFSDLSHCKVFVNSEVGVGRDIKGKIERDELQLVLGTLLWSTSSLGDFAGDTINFSFDTPLPIKIKRAPLGLTGGLSRSKKGCDYTAFLAPTISGQSSASITGGFTLFEASCEEALDWIGDQLQSLVSLLH